MACKWDLKQGWAGVGPANERICVNLSVDPLVTVIVPSYNQARFLDDAIASIFQQNIPVEVFVMDGGSKDNSIDVIRRWSSKISGWRSHPDGGQAAAINEGVSLGRAPYVAWVNSDDWLLPGGLGRLVAALDANPDAPAAYGRAWNVADPSRRKTAVWVEPFCEARLALRCIISQPATLIRRDAWEGVGGLDESLKMAMDYDFWWRIYKNFGPLKFVDDFVAVNREHDQTKTRRFRRLHYQEAMRVVAKHHGRVPLKWWLAQPYSVWFKSVVARFF